MANPTLYTKTNNKLPHITQYMTNEFEEELKNMSGKCMEIGCGPGDATTQFILSAIHPEATLLGTDLSVDMIKYAEKLYSNERLKFEVLDIQTKHLPEKHLLEYDHLFSFYTLHWCNDIRQAFENIHRMLRPGGTMLVVNVVHHDVVSILCNMAQDIRYKSYMKRLQNFLLPFNNSPVPHKEMRALLKSIGFNVLHCSHRDKCLVAEDASKLPFLIFSFVTQFFEDMPNDLLEQFKDEYAQNYMRRRFSYKIMRHEEEKIISDVCEILVVYAQKDNGV